MNENLELKLQAWVDGELSPAETRRIGALAAEDAEAARLVAELRSLKSDLAGNEMALAVPETREFYWSKIQRQIERETRSPRPERVSVPAWRRWLAPLTGFAALACMLVLALKPFAPPTFDEIASTGDGIEAVTFHDQAAGMTVVWLSDTSDQDPPADTTAPAPDNTKTQDTGDSEVEMD